MTFLTNIISTHQTLYFPSFKIYFKSQSSLEYTSSKLKTEISVRKWNSKINEKVLGSPQEAEGLHGKKKKYDQTFATIYIVLMHQILLFCFEHVIDQDQKWLKKGGFWISWFPLECNHNKNGIFILFITEFLTKTVSGTW